MLCFFGKQTFMAITINAMRMMLLASKFDAFNSQDMISIADTAAEHYEQSTEMQKAFFSLQMLDHTIWAICYLAFVIKICFVFSENKHLWLLQDSFWELYCFIVHLDGGKVTCSLCEWFWGTNMLVQFWCSWHFWQISHLTLALKSPTYQLVVCLSDLQQSIKSQSCLSEYDDHEFCSKALIVLSVRLWWSWVL